MTSAMKPIVGPNGSMPIVGAAPQEVAGTFRSYLDRNVKDWSALNRRVGNEEARLPAPLREIVSLQRSMNAAGLEVHLLSSAAEAANQLLRRLQQAAGG